MATKIKFEYFCATCKSPAKKKPLKADPNWRLADASKHIGLGSWECTGKCGKGVKVIRRKVKEE